uniref:Uncharacterized protein n=1 Tax=Salix viminalis TaxID=40686 RepID=A0A6N2M6Y4_SALVM
MEEVTVLAKLHNRALPKALIKLKNQLRGYTYSVFDAYTVADAIFNSHDEGQSCYLVWRFNLQQSSHRFDPLTAFEINENLISEVSKAINQEGPDSFCMNPMEYGRFLVLSLGTGTAKSEGKYDADEAAKWGIIGWLTADNSTPLVDVYTQASAGMVDFHISTFFQALNCEENYL